MVTARAGLGARLLPRALRVVPWVVQLRVALAVASGLAGVIALALWLRHSPGLGLLLGLPLVVGGSYVGWCMWPRWRWGFGELVGELPRPEGQRVRLTVDDGPTPGVTDAILDLLAVHRVRASFFVLLPKARQHQQLIRRIVAEGHVLGLHGEDHRSPFFRSADELAASLGRAQTELEAIAGQPVDLYRPSHGWKNLALRTALQRLRLKVVFWDYGIWDTDAPPAETLVRRLRAVTPSSADDAPILLVHDGRGDPPARPAHAEPLLAALATWLPSCPEAAVREAAWPGGRLLAGLFGLLLLGWVLRPLDLRELGQALAATPLWVPLLIALLNVVATGLEGLRFWALCPAGLSWRRHVELCFALHTGNILAPLRAGELLRPWLLGRGEPPLRTVVAWSLVEKALEAVALLPFIAVAALLFGRLVGRAWLLPAGAGGLLVAAATLVRLMRQRLRAAGAQVKPGAVALALLLSVAIWGLNWAMFVAVLPRPGQSLLVLLAVNVGLALPGLPAGLGPYEAAFVAAGQLFGHERAALLGAAVVSHGAQVLSTLALGIWPLSLLLKRGRVPW